MRWYLKGNLEAEEGTLSCEWSSDSSSESVSDSVLLEPSLLASLESPSLALLLLLGWVLMKRRPSGSGTTKELFNLLTGSTWGVVGDDWTASSEEESRAPRGSPCVRVRRSGLCNGLVQDELDVLSSSQLPFDRLSFLTDCCGSFGFSLWFPFTNPSVPVVGSKSINGVSPILAEGDFNSSLSSGWIELFASFISRRLRMLLRAHCNRSAITVLAGFRWLSTSGEFNISPNRKLADLNSNTFPTKIPNNYKTNWKRAKT